MAGEGPFSAVGRNVRETNERRARRGMRTGRTTTSFCDCCARREDEAYAARLKPTPAQPHEAAHTTKPLRHRPDPVLLRMALPVGLADVKHHPTGVARAPDFCLIRTSPESYG